MNQTNKATSTITATVLAWGFVLLFVTIGVLNIILVHPVPGTFYLLLSLIYLPPVTSRWQQKFHLALPLGIKVIIGLIVLWGTLAITDLAEILGM